jgi:hypothetical protein
VSAAQQTRPAVRRLRLVDGGAQEPGGREAVRRALAFRPRPSNAALALTDDDHAPPPVPRPRLRLVGQEGSGAVDPFDVPAEAVPLGDGREPVWLGEFLERAAAVLRERPRTVEQYRGRVIVDELARIRRLRPVSDSSAPARRGPERTNVVELHRHRRQGRRPAGSWQC